MRNLYTLIVLLFAGLTATAQSAQPRIPSELANRSMIFDTKTFTGVEEVTAAPANPLRDPRTEAGQLGSREFTQWIIGNSYYDLQSNSSVQNRCINNSPTRSGVWTMSLQSSAFTDRGTGYNTTDEDLWPEIPYERIESVRTGWPSVLQTTDKEVVVAHDFPNNLVISRRDIGASTWDQETLPNDVPEGLVWPRAVAGGADGNSIHLIAISAPAGNQTNVPTLTYEGMDGALLYYRSQDQGETWDVQNMLVEGIDSTLFLGFRADTYAIFSRGDKVAFGVFNGLSDSFLMVSEDNGDTWTKTLLVDFPVDLYTGDDEIIDLDEDMVADTIYNTDNGGCVFIDEAMNTHVAWGNMRYLDDVLGDGVWSYFPFTDGLAYWNETMEPLEYEEIAFSIDADESGVLDWLEDIGLYFMSTTGMPQIGGDANGDLYISYAGLTETHGTATQNYRHLYLIKSTDGGVSWSDPVDGTPDEGFDGYEVSFPAMGPVVDDYVHIVYQRDFEPGLGVRGDEDPIDLNDIMYYRITSDLDAEEVVSVNDISDLEKVEIFPNPTDDIIQVVLPNMVNVNIDIYDMGGRIVMSQSNVNGYTTFDLRNLDAGMYFVQMSAEGYKSAQKLILE